MAELSYCAREVRRHDNDRFLTVLLAPGDRREDLFALYAFNAEIAKTREVVSEPTLGMIRLQWWRDAVDGAFAGTAPRHGVMDPLSLAIRRHGPDQALFHRLIEGREADLDDAPPTSLSCLINYAEVTSSPLMQLAAQLLDVQGEEAMEAARLAGIAWALTGILRAVPFHASQGRTLLPLDLLRAAGLVQGDQPMLAPGDALSGVVREVAGAARGHLEKARASRRAVPSKGRAALLPAALAGLYLRAIERNGFDPFAPRVQMPHPLRQVVLAWAAVTGKW